MKTGIFTSLLPHCLQELVRIILLINICNVTHYAVVGLAIDSNYDLYTVSGGTSSQQFPNTVFRITINGTAVTEEVIFDFTAANLSPCCGNSLGYDPVTGLLIRENGGALDFR